MVAKRGRYQERRLTLGLGLGWGAYLLSPPGPRLSGAKNEREAVLPVLTLFFWGPWAAEVMF